MINVNWAFNIGHTFRDESLLSNVEITTDIFTSLVKETNQNRKNVIFKRCPAHTNFLKNTYVLKSPIDIELEIVVSDTTKDVYSKNLPQHIFEQIIDFRFLDDNERGESPFPILGIDFLNSFTVDQSLLLQVFPAFMHQNDFTQKCTVIPGEFDIHKWVRPVELVFECHQQRQTIQIKKGDALSYFKFCTDESVKIIKGSMPLDDIVACNEIVKSSPWKPLKDRYESYGQYKKSVSNNDNT
jgi:hypothetical protein